LGFLCAIGAGGIGAAAGVIGPLADIADMALKNKWPAHKVAEDLISLGTAGAVNSVERSIATEATKFVARALGTALAWGVDVASAAEGWLDPTSW
jgi:hypothetical protein